MAGLRRTPKIFGSSYQPPAPKASHDWSRSWRPIIYVVVVAAAIILIGRLPVFRIKSIELSGDPAGELQGRLDDLAGQSIFSSRVSRAVTSIKAEVTVKEFSCRRGLPSSLRCVLTIKKPELVWQSGQTLYLVDDQGVIFASATGDTTGLTVIEDTKTQPVKIGTVIVSPETIRAYGELITRLQAQSLSVSRLLLDESFYQVTVLVNRTDKPSLRILFLMSNDLTAQIEAVNSVLTQKGDNILERIDVRVPGYVYVK